MSDKPTEKPVEQPATNQGENTAGSPASTADTSVGGKTPGAGWESSSPAEGRAGDRSAGGGGRADVTGAGAPDQRSSPGAYGGREAVSGGNSGEAGGSQTGPGSDAGGKPDGGRPAAQGRTGEQPAGKPADVAGPGEAGKENAPAQPDRADVTGAGDAGQDSGKANYQVDVIRGKGPDDSAAVIWRNEQEGGDVILEIDNNAHLDQYLKGEVTANDLVRDGHAIWTGVGIARGDLPHPSQSNIPGAPSKDSDTARKEPAPPAGKEPAPAGGDSASPASGEGPPGEKTTLPDGTSVERQGGSTRLEHPDGGKQERSPDGTNRYEGHGVTVTAIPDGPIAIGGAASVSTNPDGDVIATAKDGTQITASPQGDVWVTSPDGSSRGIGRDGTVSGSDGQGRSMVVSPDGSRSSTYTQFEKGPEGSAGGQDSNSDRQNLPPSPVQQDSITRGRDSDGTRSIGRPDGSQTTTYPDGTIVETSPDGSVKVTEPPGRIGVWTPERNLESGAWGAFLFPDINPGAWSREPTTRPDQEPAIVESPEMKRGLETKIDIYKHGDKVYLDKEDMEDALRFGLPPGAELTDFENKLLDGTAKHGKEFTILLDVERGTVGYAFKYGSGGGTEFYNRQGEITGFTQEAGLEDPGITPLDFVGAGASLAKGLVEGAAKGIAKHFVKEEVKDGAADLGSRLAKDEIKDGAASLGSQAAKGEAKDEAADLGVRFAKEGVADQAADLSRLLDKYGDDARGIVNKYGNELGTDILRSYDEIADIDGADRLMKDLLSSGMKGADDTNIGALSELGYAASLKKQGFQIERLGDKSNGKKAADILVEKGPAIDVKANNWRDPFYQRPGNVDRTAKKWEEQAQRYQQLYPGRPVEFALTDLQNAPQKIIEALERNNVNITQVTWPRGK